MSHNLKGVITAGGLGTRLLPMTRVTNKHLLPVYDRPMIFYPIQTLVNAGITDIMIITGGNHAGDFLPLLGNGHEFGLKRLHFTYQAREGIAGIIPTQFCRSRPVIVILGDTIFERISISMWRISGSGKGLKFSCGSPEQYSARV